jgi:putative membrane protein
MTRLLTPFAGLLCLCVTAVRANDDKRSDEKAFDDNTFVQKVASGGMHEVALGQIAEKKAGTEVVKAFAARMVKDHTKANEALKKAASTAGFTFPDKMNDHDQKEVDNFANYKGDDFDRQYIKHMVSDHEQDVALFKQASKEAKNPALKEFATKTLPVVEEHLAAAKKIQGMQ